MKKMAVLFAIIAVIVSLSPAYAASKSQKDPLGEAVKKFGKAADDLQKENNGLRQDIREYLPVLAKVFSAEDVKNAETKIMGILDENETLINELREMPKRFPKDHRLQMAWIGELQAKMDRVMENLVIVLKFQKNSAEDATQALEELKKNLRQRYDNHSV